MPTSGGGSRTKFVPAPGVESWQELFKKLRERNILERRGRGRKEWDNRNAHGAKKYESASRKEKTNPARSSIPGNRKCTQVIANDNHKHRYPNLHEGKHGEYEKLYHGL